ncbi:MAG TPA: cohesin domain-containing protein [Candidatus Saccharimonadales bacterium]|nr:cohesin domain-containing protein [Candidatus Saccharimonadales bacterium]
MSLRGIKNKIRAALIVSISTITASAAMVAPAHAAGSGTMYVQAVNQMVVGATFTIQVRVNTGGAHVNAVESDFTYDTGKLTFNSIDDASMSPFEINATSTENSGTVSIGRGTLSSGGISGDFKVANITFTVTHAGTAAITFQNTSELDDSTSNSDILGTKSNGSFTNQPGLYGGQTLASGAILYSSNSQYSARMQSDGNFAVYNASNVPLWSTKTSGHPGAHAILQTDGNFVIYSTANKALWSAQTYWYNGSRAVMQNDGNFAVYNVSGRPLWSRTTGAIFNFMISGQTLQPGDFLKSTDNRFTCKMQTDGNFVVYQTGGGALFNTHTAGHPGAVLKMQSDGNMVVYDNDNVALWNTHTSGKPGAKAILQTDGNLVLYQGNTALWSWKTGRKY